MLPPLPPSPPSGPPRGTFFSRLKLSAPSPPLPEWTSIRASSMNFMKETKKPYRVDRAPYLVKHCLLYGIRLSAPKIPTRIPSFEAVHYHPRPLSPPRGSSCCSHQMFIAHS